MPVASLSAGLVAAFAAGPWQTNCYLVAAGPDSDCLVIDPGYGATPTIIDLVERHRLRPVAVLATHGHLDHVFAAAEVADRFAVPTWIHPADRRLLSEPLAGLGADLAPLVAELTGDPACRLTEPSEVRELDDGDLLELAGLPVQVVHAPGHTPGSVLLTLPWSGQAAVAAGEPPVDRLIFTGDVLFAGSIGRTDLPGGDAATMRNSLRERVLPMDDPSRDAALLPGHGTQTTLAHERATNPFLQPAQLHGPVG